MANITHVTVEKQGEHDAWTNACCFTWESTERWVRMFAGKRYDCIRDDDRLKIGEDEKAVKEYEKYRKDYIRGFAREMHKIIEQKKNMMRSKPSKDDNKKK